MAQASEAIVLRAPGGPEALVLEAIEVESPGPGQLLIRQSAASVNFHDIYVRSGAYQTLPLPGIPGLEAVGRVEALGEGVTQFAVGDRVAYISRNYGGYARLRVIDEVLAVPVPETIDDGVATAWFLKGLTAQALVQLVALVCAGVRLMGLMNRVYGLGCRSSRRPDKPASEASSGRHRLPRPEQGWGPLGPPARLARKARHQRSGRHPLPPAHRPGWRGPRRARSAPCGRPPAPGCAARGRSAWSQTPGGFGLRDAQR